MTKNVLTTAEIYLQVTTTNPEFSADTSLFIFVISGDFKDYGAAQHLQMLLLYDKCATLADGVKHCVENHTNHVLIYRKRLLDDKSGIMKH